MSNSLVKNEQKKETISTFMCKPAVKARIMEMMSGKDGEQFITSIVAAVNQTPALAECDMMSIFNSAMQIQALKLSPSPALGQAFMIPFKNKKKSTKNNVVKDAVFVIGFKGYIQLAIRSGFYKKINVLALKQGELIKFNEATEEIEIVLIEDEEIREALDTTHYYAYFEYQNGFQKVLCWSKSKIISHACKYVPFFTKKDYENFTNGEVKQEDEWKFSGYWYKDFDGQALKTMIRQLISKWGIMSVDFQQAIKTETESDIQENKAQEEFVFAEKSDPMQEPEHTPEPEPEQKVYDIPADNAVQTGSFEW